MREQLSREEGAVAVLVAILTVVLVGLSAFVIDFGIAYATKTSLQKAADAASLAAAGEIIQLASPTDTCADITSRWNSDSVFQAQVMAQADSIAQQNLSMSRRTNMTVQCSSDNKRVEVSYSNTGSNATVLGGIFGVHNVTSFRTATADVFAATSGVGLRPYALCALDAQDLVTAADGGGQKWIGIPYPNPLCGNYNGNWYTLNCPEDMGNNGTSQFASDTLNGCKDEVGIIPSDSVWTSIVSQCTDSAKGLVDTPQDCMMANPGNVRASEVVSAWDVLLTKPSIMVPVFDPNWNTYSADQVKQCTTGGNSGCYPIKALASVKVCGYSWGSKTNYTDAGVCSGVGAAVQAVKGPGDELWLALTQSLQTTGTSGPGGVAVGQAFGVYGTRLIK